MSIIPESVLTTLATDFFVTPTIKVALYYNTGAPFTSDSVFADVEPYLIADGYLGSTWQELVVTPGDLSFDGLLLGFPNQALLFGRDSSATPLTFNGIAIINEDQVGSNHILLATQASTTTLTLYSGQGAQVYVAGGFVG